MHTTGAGSKHPFAVRDSKGEHLSDSNTQRPHLSPNPPAALFWAVTAYNITDGTMRESSHAFPPTNSSYDIPKDADGSIDIWFGPEKPAGVADTAYVQTVSRRAF